MKSLRGIHLFGIDFGKAEDDLTILMVPLDPRSRAPQFHRAVKFTPQEFDRMMEHRVGAKRYKDRRAEEAKATS